MTTPPPNLPSLAVLPDFPEEDWPSMNLVAEMLLKHLTGSDLVRATRACARWQRRLSFLGRRGRNFDRLRNRMRVYPKFARSIAGDFDCFHLCDHSYSQLVHQLPPERTGVFCHDLDTFRCILDPAKEPRPKWFRKMATTILEGLQKASIVFHLTTPVRQQILHHNLIDPSKLIRCPAAPAEEFTPTEPPEDSIASTPSSLRRFVASSLPPTSVAPSLPHPLLLHVGSTIARKRIDILLKTFAAARSANPDLRLLQIGGEWTAEQRELIDSLHLAPAMHQVRGVSRHDIAHAYRNAALVLQPSDAEGFGLPVIEALACAAPVLASDIPVLREVGGEAVLYAPPGDSDAWAHAAVSILAGRLPVPDRAARLRQAGKFSWQEHARTIAAAYHAMTR